MLSPEEVAAARQKLGIKAPPDPVVANRTSVLDSAWGAPKQPGLLSKAVKGAEDIFSERGQKATDIAQEGASHLQQHAGNPFVGAKDLLETGLRQAGNVAGAVGDMFAKPIAAASNAAADNPLVQRVASHPAVSAALDSINSGASHVTDAWNKVQTDHPELAKDLGAVANIALLGGGGKAVDASAGAALRGSKSVSEAVVAGAKQGAEKIAQKFTPTEEATNNIIKEKFMKAVKPTVAGRTTAASADKFGNDIVDAVRTIASNKHNLTFVNDVGEETVDQLPKSLRQLGESIDQTKKTIFDNYDSLAKKADGQGAKIDVTKVVSPLDEVINSKSLALSHPEAIEYAKKIKDRYESAGTIDTHTAQDLVKNYNNSLESFYRNPSYDTASRAAIDASVVNNLRGALDHAIENATGDPYYSVLKKQYGALKNIEKDVFKRANVEARKQAKGLIDYTDIFSGGDIVHGILTMNPALFAKGAAQKGIKDYFKFINDPNRAVDHMFKAVDKHVQGKSIVGNAAKSAAHYLDEFNQNPRMGLQLQDVSKTKPVAHDAATVAEEHITSAKQIIDNLPASELESLGGMSALIDRTKTNIVDGLKADGFTKEASAIDKLNASAFKDVNSFDKAMRIALPKAQGGAPEAAFKNFEDISTKLLGKLERRTTVSKQFIEDLTNSPDLKQPEKDLFRSLLKEEGDKINVTDFANKVKSELLPLTTNKATNASGSGRYESITLPDELRGPIANYEERIYQSPIKTSAGSVHFDTNYNDGYFAHSRVEDLPTTKAEIDPTKGIAFGEKLKRLPTEPTRRVIELQSDLFQKGRLENEVDTHALQAIADEKEAGISQWSKTKEAKAALAHAEEIKKLEPYRNTWHERVIREEVKQAAKDGKTKLQFPTGETAMKIEGLGSRNNWQPVEDGMTAATVLTPADLKIGAEASNGNTRWIITAVLGDGKFKAVPKQRVDQLKYGKASEEDTKRILDSVTEQFDISGKVDTENPIYKFYEKEVGKYLKNKYDAQLITDPQGVQWWEVNVKPEHKTSPVEAFGVAAGLGIGAEANKH